MITIANRLGKLIRQFTTVKDVYQLRLPDNCDKPAISFAVFKSDPGYVQGGPGGLTTRNIQIDVWGTKDQGAKVCQIMEDLETRLHGYFDPGEPTSDNFIQAILVDNAFVGWQDTDEAEELYHGVLDITVTHKTLLGNSGG